MFVATARWSSASLVPLVAPPQRGSYVYYPRLCLDLWHNTILASLYHLIAELCFENAAFLVTALE
jgi:hypothetical protein